MNYLFHITIAFFALSARETQNTNENMEARNFQNDLSNLNAYKSRYSSEFRKLRDVGFTDAMFDKMLELHLELVETVGFRENLPHYLPIPTPGTGWCMVLAIIGSVLSKQECEHNHMKLAPASRSSITSWKDKFCAFVSDNDVAAELRRFFEHVPSSETRRELDQELGRVVRNEDVGTLDRSLGDIFVKHLTRAPWTGENGALKVFGQQEIGHLDVVVHYSDLHFTLMLPVTVVSDLSSNELLRDYLSSLPSFWKPHLQSEGYPKRRVGVRTVAMQSAAICDALCRERVPARNCVRLPGCPISQELQERYSFFSTLVSFRNESEVKVQLQTLASQILEEATGERYTLSDGRELTDEVYVLVFQMNEKLSERNEMLSVLAVCDEEYADLRALETLDKELLDLKGEIVAHLLGIMS